MGALRSDLKGKIVTFGNFDGVHVGHVRLISTMEKLAKEHDFRSLLITFSPHPVCFFRKCENDFSIIRNGHKELLIKNLGIDDVKFLDFNHDFAGMSAEDFICNFLFYTNSVKIIVVGEKCRFGKGRTGDIAVLKKLSAERGVSLIIQDLVQSKGLAFSSSRIRECLKLGDIELVNKILGRNYSVIGEILHGEKRGAKIGFPTINLSMDDLLKPMSGVYLGCVRFGNYYHYGVVNVGIRPTFGDISESILEMHIFDFNRDVYGEIVEVELLTFIREEKKFSGISELVMQIREDVSKSYAIMGNKEIKS